MEPTKLKNAHSAAGPSLLEKLWTELDTVMDRLMADGKPQRDKYMFDRSIDDSNGYLVADEHADQLEEAWTKYGEERGQAQGIAYAIALIENPYKVSVPRVKKKAMKRWEARNAEK